MIKKLAIILLLVGLFCYFIAAVTVLNKPKEGLVCNGVEVVVEDSLQTGFIQSGEVLRLLKAANATRRDKNGPGDVEPDRRGFAEESLYRGRQAIRRPAGRCVRVKQRLPILHVMSSDGQNYYLTVRPADAEIVLLRRLGRGDRRYHTAVCPAESGLVWGG